MNESQILFFILTSVAVILIPGQDLVLVMSKGMTQGAKAGFVTAAGVSFGLLGHTILAALGLGALLVSSDVVFTAIKYIGAAYLAYLGVRLLLGPGNTLNFEDKNRASLKKLFLMGALSNITNPKITIFYFAFLPQFVSADIASPTFHLLALGSGFAALTFLVKAPIGLFSGVASMYIQSRPIIIRVINRISGTVLLGLGANLAFDEC